jgi:hypothetical protein
VVAEVLEGTYQGQQHFK